MSYLCTIEQITKGTMKETFKHIENEHRTLERRLKELEDIMRNVLSEAMKNVGMAQTNVTKLGIGYSIRFKDIIVKPMTTTYHVWEKSAEALRIFLMNKPPHEWKQTLTEMVNKADGKDIVNLNKQGTISTEFVRKVLEEIE